MDTLLAESTTKRGGAVTTAARNATGATSREVANSGCLASVWIKNTDKDTQTRFTACQGRNTNQHMKNTKNGLTTTKATLQPYSQKELKEIAENVARYRRESLREYTYTNDEGDAVVATVKMSRTQGLRLELMQRDLHRHGTHNEEAADGFTYKVLGTTIC